MSIFQAYHLLGVNPTFTDEEIKRAHRTKSRDTHPDRHPGKAEEFHKIQVAFRQIRSQADRANAALRLSQLGSPCHACKGKGFQTQHKSFTVKLWTDCQTCGSCGYIERKR